MYANEQRTSIYLPKDKMKRAQSGNGIIIHKNLKSNINKWNCILDRLLSVEISLPEVEKLTISVGYVHSGNKLTEIKHEFWNTI